MAFKIRMQQTDYTKLQKELKDLGEHILKLEKQIESIDKPLAQKENEL